MQIGLLAFDTNVDGILPVLIVTKQFRVIILYFFEISIVLVVSVRLMIATTMGHAKVALTAFMTEYSKVTSRKFLI